MARLLRTVPNAKAHSRLFPPAVIRAGIVPRPIDATLVATLESRNSRLRSARAAHPKYRGPVVVLAPAVVVIAFHGPGTRLTNPTDVGDVRLRRRPMASLARPVWVYGPYAPSGPEVRLASRIPRRSVRSRLGHPTVVTAVVATVFTGPETHLAYSRRGVAKSRLRPPAVVGAGIVFRPVLKRLSYSRRGTPRSRLNPPVAPPTARPIETKVATELALVERRPRVPHSKLSHPAVVGNGIYFRPVDVTLVRGRAGHARPRLAPPAVVGNGIYFSPVEVHLAPSKRGKPRSFLLPPIIPPLAPPVEKKLAVELAITDRAHTRTISRLFPPAVVGNGIYFARVDVHLAPSKRGVPKPRLAPPAVVGAGIVYYPVRTHLAYSRRGVPKSRLNPAIIPPLARPEVEKLAVQLTTLDRAHTHTLSRLSPPAVVGGGIYFRPVKVTLVRIRPPKRFWKLSPPTAVQSATLLFFGPITELTYSRRGKPSSVLAPPAVVGNGIYFAPVDVHLAYSRKGAPKSRLNPPVIPPTARPIETELSVQLAVDSRLSRRQRSRLSPPAVVGGGIYFRAVDVTVVRGRAGHARPELSPPAVIGAGVVYAPIKAHLAYSRRGAPKSRLNPAIIPPLAPPVEERLAVELAATGRRHIRTRSRLAPPAVVGGGIYFRPVDTTLVRIKPPQRFARLSPPAVVQAQTVVFTGPHTELTYSRRGRPVSKLRAPAVVGNGIYFRAVQTKLTYSRRGRPTSRLFRPIIPPLARPTDTTLARIRPVAVHSVLNPPPFIAVSPFRPVNTTLIRVRPVHTRTQLRPPAIVRIFTAPPVTAQTVTLDLRRRRPSSRLFAPTVVGIPSIGYLKTTLVRNKVPKRFWRLSVPVVVNPYLPPVVTTLRVTLARITPTPGSHILHEPTVLKTPLICRVDGPPDSMWYVGKPSSDYTLDEPGMDWEASPPQSGFETDIPDDEWEAGKPL